LNSLILLNFLINFFYIFLQNINKYNRMYPRPNIF